MASDFHIAVKTGSAFPLKSLYKADFRILTLKCLGTFEKKCVDVPTTMGSGTNLSYVQVGTLGHPQSDFWRHSAI